LKETICPHGCGKERHQDILRRSEAITQERNNPTKKRLFATESTDKTEKKRVATVQDSNTNRRATDNDKTKTRRMNMSDKDGEVGSMVARIPLAVHAARSEKINPKYLTWTKAKPAYLFNYKPPQCEH
jgi:hypothetical protein